MTRSERLAREGKIEVFIGSVEIAKVIDDEDRAHMAGDLRYIGSDFEALYDGKEVCANIYENVLTDDLFATIGK